MKDLPRVGISECLLGRPVRYDGGHKLDRFIADTLGAWVELVPTCPEVEVGLGTPRPPMRLVATSDGPRLVVRGTGEDLTDRMATWARRRVGELGPLDGFVLKKDSPSCGMERVKVWNEAGQAARTGIGVFAEALMGSDPSLPVEEEGRLNDPQLRENFIVRVYTRRRWRALLDQEPTVTGLQRFHASMKMTLLAHDPEAYKGLGRLVADARASNLAETLRSYGYQMMAGLARPASRGRHVNVLQHLAGYVSDALDADDRAELADAIRRYGEGLVPLVVPITLLRHHLRRHGGEWALSQTYLDPYPGELMLRNRV